MEKRKKTFGICDNTNCRNEDFRPELFKVEMKKEFEGGVFDWCEECIKRDKDMVKEKKEIEIEKGKNVFDNPRKLPKLNNILF